MTARLPNPYVYLPSKGDHSCHRLISKGISRLQQKELEHWHKISISFWQMEMHWWMKQSVGDFITKIQADGGECA